MNRSTLKMLARLGYAARGIVYLVIGSLAVKAAMGDGGATTGSRGAIRELADEPTGQILVAVVAIGLVGYAVWRFIQAVFDADDHGTDAEALAVRGGLFVSAITHSLIAIFAFSLLFGSGGGSGGDGTESWTAKLLSQPFGQWLVGLVGVAVIGAGIAHAIKAWKTKFERYLDMSESQMRLFRPVAIFGLVARGIVFVITGGFFIVAAWQAQPEEARSMGETLQTLQGQPYGAWLLGIVAVGLFAFGIYSSIEAIFRQIPHVDTDVTGGSESAGSRAASLDEPAGAVYRR